MLASPRPRSTHDDIALQQQHSDTGSPDCFRLTGRGPDRRPGDTRGNPQCGGADIGRDPRREHPGMRARPHSDRPHQLEGGQSREKHSRRQPVAPMHRRDRDMNHGCPQRRDRRTAGGHTTLGLRHFPGGHGIDSANSSELGRASAHHSHVPERKHRNPDLRRIAGDADSGATGC